MKKLISWVEIPTVNFERAVKFYNAVLNLNLQPTDYGQEKMACFPNGEGAIVHAPNFNPSADGTLVSFNVNKDLDRSISKVNEEGGKIVQPKTKIMAEERGFFAIFIDTEGNKAGLYGDN